MYSYVQINRYYNGLNLESIRKDDFRGFIMAIRKPVRRRYLEGRRKPEGRKTQDLRRRVKKVRRRERE